MGEEVRSVEGSRKWEGIQKLGEKSEAGEEVGSGEGIQKWEGNRKLGGNSEVGRESSFCILNSIFCLSSSSAF